jgi:lipopolysaccharide/colanic/teichoic acid biosynthesis glycosyltransferase
MTSTESRFDTDIWKILEQRAQGREEETPQLLEVSPHFDSQRMRSLLAGILLLIPALPIMACIAIIVKLFSRGPVLYRQQRVGLHGEEFTILKFRSMRVDAEVGTGPVWAQKKDPRVTRIGRFLRATHLDELPQLFNVVRGDMALVGPRPERPEIVSRLVDRVPDYESRLLVRPGITGLAQVTLPPDETLECVRAKIQVDLKYIQEANLSLDLRIIACTAAKMCCAVKLARVVFRVPAQMPAAVSA